MSTLTTAIVAWFFAFAGVDTLGPCVDDAPAQTCPAGPPPPDASSGSGSSVLGGGELPAGKPAARPTKDDGIYNGI